MSDETRVYEKQSSKKLIAIVFILMLLAAIGGVFVLVDRMGALQRVTETQILLVTQTVGTTATQTVWTQPTTPQVLPSIEEFVGDWRNIDSNTRSITRIEVTRNGDSLVLHVWGACEPTNCDWDVVSGQYHGQPFVAVYVFSFAVETLTLTIGGSQLHVQSFTHFTDNSGRSDYTSDDYFTR